MPNDYERSPMLEESIKAGKKLTRSQKAMLAFSAAQSAILMVLALAAYWSPVWLAIYVFWIQ